VSGHGPARALSAVNGTTESLPPDVDCAHGVNKASPTRSCCRWPDRTVEPVCSRGTRSSHPWSSRPRTSTSGCTVVDCRREPVVEAGVGEVDNAGLLQIHGPVLKIGGIEHVELVGLAGCDRIGEGGMGDRADRRGRRGDVAGEGGCRCGDRCAGGETPSANVTAAMVPRATAPREHQLHAEEPTKAELVCSRGLVWRWPGCDTQPAAVPWRTWFAQSQRIRGVRHRRRHSPGMTARPPMSVRRCCCRLARARLGRTHLVIESRLELWDRVVWIDLLGPSLELVIRENAPRLSGLVGDRTAGILNS
jgi:hypothetical protein